MASPESGFAKDDRHVRMQIELRRNFYNIAAGQGRRYHSATQRIFFPHMINGRRIIIAVNVLTSRISGRDSSAVNFHNEMARQRC